MTTNDKIPPYDVKGWRLWDTSPVTLEEAHKIRSRINGEGVFFAKTSDVFYCSEDGKEYAYIRVTDNTPKLAPVMVTE